MTETWQRVDGKWLLRLVHTDRIRINPPAINLTTQQIDELVGTYHGAGGTYVVQRDGSAIFGRRNATPALQLKAETRDVLFTPDNVYMRKIFQRDAAGRVTGFVDRDENSDRVWLRSAPPQQAGP
jgi:hypothetical protein